MPNNPFYKTREWQAARGHAVKRAHKRCENCTADVSGKGASRVDHIIPRAVRPDLALVDSNLRVLCVNCDAKRHAHKATGAPAGLWSDLRPVDRSGWPTAPGHHWNRTG